MPAEAPGLLPSCGGQFMSATPTRLPFLSTPATIPGLSMNIYPNCWRVSHTSARRTPSAEPGRRTGRAQACGSLAGVGHGGRAARRYAAQPRRSALRSAERAPARGGRASHSGRSSAAGPSRWNAACNWSRAAFGRRSKAPACPARARRSLRARGHGRSRRARRVPPAPTAPRRPQVALSGSRRLLRCPGVRSFRAPPPAAGHTRVLVLAIPEIPHCCSRHICARRIRVSVVATRSAMRGRHELARAVDDRATASPWAECTRGLKDGVLGRAAYAACRYHRRNRAVPVVVLPLEQVRSQRSEHHQDSPRGAVPRSFVLRPRMGRWSPLKHSKSSLPRTPGQLSGHEGPASAG